MRTFYNGLVKREHVGNVVSLCGWVNRRRDHGGVIFIDLRDHTGIVQIVFNPMNENSFKEASNLRNEYCICITGIVHLRPIDSINREISSGEIEIICDSITLLNTSITPPFNIDDDNISEIVRLSYRYIDLRRSKMQYNLRIRYSISMEVRKFLDKLNFIDIETPFLTKSTPEGARDYLVPSRMNPGNFFALPQSPQIFKQLLMISGFDRYYQITKCFRDEDLRADRQPEFTQIDCEMSFMNENEIRNIFETMIRHIFKKVVDIELPSIFPVLTWKQSMDKYGTDKPDLRIKLDLVDITELAQKSEFKIFSDISRYKKGKIVALKVPNGAKFSRKDIEYYTEIVKIYGGKGLAYIKINDVSLGRAGLQSPIVKNLSDEIINNIINITQAKTGDIIFFGADRYNIVNSSMSALISKIGNSDFAKTNNIFKSGWYPLWIIDFPMFEYDEINKKYSSVHHPFTSPSDLINEKNIDPEKILSKSYDLVINGWEIGGGSIRIHSEKIQRKVFKILDINDEEAQDKFGFLLNALKYGAPPHGGIAFGLDRLVSIILNTESIRDVIAFPKTQKAQCLLTHSPSKVKNEQLTDLHISLSKNI